MHANQVPALDGEGLLHQEALTEQSVGNQIDVVNCTLVHSKLFGIKFHCYTAS